jgi:hypothetical protein
VIKIKVCEHCGKEFSNNYSFSNHKRWLDKEYKEKTMNKIKKTHNTLESRKLSSDSKLGNLNPAWKGDNVGYVSLHDWIKRRKPKSMFCEKCGEITSKLDCANISGEYKRDISDFRWLCRRCHMKEDGRIKNLMKFKFKIGNIPWNK